MSKLAIIGTIEVARGSRKQLLPFLMAHRARCLKDEPGTLQFEALLPNDNETKIMLYEVYQNAAAFEAHWNGPSLARMREEAASMIVKIYGTRCSLSE